MQDKPEEQWTRERCFITELINNVDTPEVSIARARVEAGVTTERHSLSVYEWYVIEAGCGRMTVGDGAAEKVTAGDVIAVPKGIAQRICNDGEEDLIFLCICAPRFSQECYTSLE